MKRSALIVLLSAAIGTTPALAQSFFFSTGSPDGLMAMASRPDSTGKIEIESADDFLLTSDTKITSATFTGLLPPGVSLSSVGEVQIEIYRVFPLDSTVPPSGHVPTRNNSPSDVAFDTRSSTSGGLTFTPGIINPNFTANNSVLNGIHPSPNQTTNGEGPVTGQEVQFNVLFSTPFTLAAGHYFFIPQVELPTGKDFYWLSAPKPIVAGPGTPFNPDLQAWIRNANLDPDWLRVGTDIVGGATPPQFNATFTLAGEAVPEPATLSLLAVGLALVAGRLWKCRS